MSGVLAERYTSIEMKNIWSRETKILLERDLWIAVLKTQQRLGLEVLDEVIHAYEMAKKSVDLERIDSREKKLKHDVKAKIEEFNFLAGHEVIHIGMTSRDLTENVETIQIRQSLELIEMKALAFLFKLGEKIRIFKGLPIVARTHNVPAQVTTLGKRFATWAEELMFATKHVQELRNRLPLRGIKGAVGTQQDLMSVLDSLSVNLDDQIAQLFEFKHIAASSSQIYPRSFDYEIITSLVQLSAAATNVATNVRLMSGFGLVNEGLTENQVGSSAMPHKNNARLSERVTGLGVVLKGYAMMLSDISGNQWNEGDVSCSVVRRVALPEAFFAIDAILDTSINIISNLVINERAIESELTENLPFLLSSKILMKAVQGGLGRETAHKLIRKHALEALDNFYQSGENNFLELITKDQHLGIPSEFLKALADTPLQHTGRSQSQCDLVLDQIARCCNDRSDIVSYSPEDPR